MTETQERFLRAIAERVPPERVVELHLFPSLRQGAVESGVAVIAAEPERPGGGWRSERGDAAGAACDPTDDAAGPPPEVAEAPEVAAAAIETEGAGAGSEDSARLVAEDEIGPTASLSNGHSTPHPPPATRLTIYTARYRLAIKGPDRGKWEASVAAEADAPLVTLEAVVRGVRRRAGEGADAERLSGDELRAALAAPAWTATR